MIKTIAIFVVCGLAYLFALEHIGNFITRDLEVFKQKVNADPELNQVTTFESSDAYRQYLLRHDLSDLVELLLDKATDEELRRLSSSMKRIEGFLQDAKINPKIDREALVDQMYHKRIVADILTERAYGGEPTQPDNDVWAAIETAVDATLKQESPQSRKVRGMINNVTSIVFGAALLYLVSRYKPEASQLAHQTPRKVKKVKQR